MKKPAAFSRRGLAALFGTGGWQMAHALVAQLQSRRLLTGWLQVRILLGPVVLDAKGHGTRQPLLELGAAQDPTDRLRLCHDLLDAIATHRVGDRPNRYEPRVKKGRRNHYGWLTKPRAEMKRKMAKGVTEN